MSFSMLAILFCHDSFIHRTCYKPILDISTQMEALHMKMAWKEIKKSKSRFIILGSIVFLVSFLTFIISGLSNGLSQDNAALIKDMPDGQFYMANDADETYNLSKIDEDKEEQLQEEHPDAVSMSIQMGF